MCDTEGPAWGDGERRRKSFVVHVVQKAISGARVLQNKALLSFIPAFVLSVLLSVFLSFFFFFFFLSSFLTILFFLSSFRLPFFPFFKLFLFLCYFSLRSTTKTVV